MRGQLQMWDVVWRAFGESVVVARGIVGESGGRASPRTY